MKSKILLALALLLCLSPRFAFSGVSEEFKWKVRNLRWIAYAPTHFDPTRGIYPSQDSIREDLRLLYAYGFNGIVTYGSERTLSEVPRIASEVGFQGVIMGIWDIENSQEINSAISNLAYVDGYCLGNEGLNSRYDIDALKRAISQLKQLTHKPATTTEQIFDYANDDVLAIGDWIFPNIHPFLAQIKDPEKAAKWIEKHYQRLEKHCPVDKIILFKETGFPTAGDDHDASELKQKEFFLYLEKANINFVYFEAFDQLWKRHLAVEPHWGLFNYARRPKKYISAFSQR
ncbi:MAG TPA: hypothetical protein VI976_00235 [Candidatus Omnitrophota bacterium]|nr:hypothetical protein [Candidatus Omnitrophota bacterium]